MENNEQWREGAGGKCEICRRHGYCKKQCSENRKMVRRVLLQGLMDGLKQRKASEDVAASPDETAQEA